MLGTFNQHLPMVLSNNRTFWIFYFYGFIRIYYGYIDYFVIRNKNLYGFIIGLWVPKNLYKSVKICTNLKIKWFKNSMWKAILHHKCIFILIKSYQTIQSLTHTYCRFWTYISIFLVSQIYTDLYRLIRIYTDLDGFIFERWVPINPYKSLLRITK